MTMVNAEAFFNLDSFPYPEVFTNLENIWEALPRISVYLNGLFSSGRLAGNFRGLKNVYVGQGTEIDDSVKITGPAVIGINCVIRHGAYFRENCLLGDNVVIGHAAEVKNSIFLNNSSAAHLNYIGDSIVGNDVNIAGGVITANLRLDHQPVKVIKGNTVINTNLRKFGAIIGDGSNIGVNAVLNPGTILGKRTKVLPLVSVKGVHHDGEFIKQ